MQPAAAFVVFSLSSPAVATQLPNMAARLRFFLRYAPMRNPGPPAIHAHCALYINHPTRNFTDSRFFISLPALDCSLRSQSTAGRLHTWVRVLQLRIPHPHPLYPPAAAISEIAYPPTHVQGTIIHPQSTLSPADGCYPHPPRTLHPVYLSTHPQFHRWPLLHQPTSSGLLPLVAIHSW